MKAEAVASIELGMLADSVPDSQGSPADAARERIKSGPIPEWVVPCAFPLDFRPERAAQISRLLLDKQLHAEKRLEYNHIAIRLENIQAVQRESEWRIDMDPRRQRITVHWIKVHRGEKQFDQTRLENIRPVAAGIEGRQSLVLLLEDVRPGDILEWAYTIEDHPVVMAAHSGCFLDLPGETPLGKLFFSVRFDASREMNWKSSSPDLAPAESQGKSEMHWVWARENIAASVREENTPAWHVTNSWIQFSDCPDWETVSEEFAAAWNDDAEDAAIKTLAQEIAASQPGILEQAEKAIHLVQDEFRCLPEDADLAGEPPVAPGIVARRRFGNSQDLSFVLVQLLRCFGVSARLALVNTKFQKSIRHLLPAPGLFNHVVVEFETGGEKRWIDATAKGQGGALLNRVIADYGAGLPVTQDSSGLAAAPAHSAHCSAYEIKETILLDTAGAPSLLGIVVAARGSHAEDLHREFESLGVDGVSRKRLQLCSDRFGQAKRVGRLEFRDDRKSNEFFLAEIFEIKDFLKPDTKPGWFKLDFPDNPVSAVLKLPGSTSRRAPFALPYPCDAVHTFEIYCVALAPGVAPEKAVDDPWLQYTWARKMLAGNWVVRSTLRTLADAVPPEAIEKHRQTIREIQAESAWSLLAPSGLQRPHQRSDFGSLPDHWESTGAEKRTPMPAPRTPEQESTGNTTPTGDTSEKAGDIRYKRRKRHRRRRKSKTSALVWAGCLAAVLLVLLIILIISLTRGAEKALPDPRQPPEATPVAQ